MEIYLEKLVWLEKLGSANVTYMYMIISESINSSIHNLKVWNWFKAVKYCWGLVQRRPYEEDRVKIFERYVVK